jgi:hypothetical protein
MNTRFFTGFVPSDAVAATVPATATTAPVRKLVFDVVIRDSRGVEFPEKCEVDDPELVKKYEPLLTSGRVVVCEGEQTAYEFRDHGVLKGWRRQVRLRRIEFPDRSAKKTTDEKPA